LKPLVELLRPVGTGRRDVPLGVTVDKLPPLPTDTKGSTVVDKDGRAAADTAVVELSDATETLATIVGLKTRQRSYAPVVEADGSDIVILEDVEVVSCRGKFAASDDGAIKATNRRPKLIR